VWANVAAVGGYARGQTRRTRESSHTAPAPTNVSTFVVAHVRQAPQQAWVAGATSVARFSTGSAFS